MPPAAAAFDGGLARAAANTAFIAIVAERHDVPLLFMVNAGEALLPTAGAEHRVQLEADVALALAAGWLPGMLSELVHDDADRDLLAFVLQELAVAEATEDLLAEDALHKRAWVLRGSPAHGRRLGRRLGRRSSLNELGELVRGDDHRRRWCGQRGRRGSGLFKVAAEMAWGTEDWPKAVHTGSQGDAVVHGVAHHLEALLREARGRFDRH